jgi:hypothetical protein
MALYPQAAFGMRIVNNGAAKVKPGAKKIVLPGGIA